MNITAEQLELISDALIFALSEGMADEKDVLHITDNIESFLNPYKQKGIENEVMFEIKKMLGDKDMKIGDVMPFMYGDEKMVGTVHLLGNVDGIPSVMFKVEGGYITKPVEKVFEQNKKFKIT